MLLRFMRSVQHLKDDLTIEIAQDYFNEVDEATDCEEPKAKTVNLYRQVLQLYFILIFIHLLKKGILRLLMAMFARSVL